MKSKFVILLLLSSLTSCSYLTKSGRQQRAYQNYVRKSSATRTRQQSKFKFRTPEMAIRQDAPVMTAQPESPQSMTTSSPSEQPTPEN